MKLTDIDTASYLAEFKEEYLDKIQKVHDKYAAFKELPAAEAKKADEVAKKLQFLSGFVACIEATLEQNFVMAERLKEKVI
jgi:hypothetical protein